MLPSFRIVAFALLGALAPGGGARAADDTLPPEPASGEWIEDTLADASLWFASSENLGFEAVAHELRDYPRGRRWVRVVDGKPAWVMYFVPGELLGFEIDTHHFGASATEFRFAAGKDWRALAPVDVDFEEIVAFEARWLRLYRSADKLPPGTRFLKIEFPPDTALDAARLTEVWLRCRYDDAPPAAPVTPLAPQSPLKTPVTAPAAPIDEPVAPFVVHGIILEPPSMPALARPVIDVDRTPPPVEVIMPENFGGWTRESLLPDIDSYIVAEPPPPAPKPRQGVFSRLMVFLHLRAPRSQ